MAILGVLGVLGMQDTSSAWQVKVRPSNSFLAKI
jgi:hypothetical protein